MCAPWSFRWVENQPSLDAEAANISQSVEPRCICNHPENPDKTLIGCTNDDCKKWLHDDCLVHDSLMNTYKRLGADKPHKPTAVKKEDRDGEGPQRPLSPSESGAAQSTQQSIDVKPEEHQTIKLVEAENGTTQMDVDGPDSSTIPVAYNGADAKKKGRRRKPEAGGSSASKPYLGRFEAVIRDDLSPPSVEIKDLREGVEGGEKSWTEPINCLVCHKAIH